MEKPSVTEYPAGIYFGNYIDQVADNDLLLTLEQQRQQVVRLFENISLEQANFRYAEGKWSPKEMLGHLTDSERIFAFRSLSIARGEQQSLPGFDENEYFAAANFDEQSVEQLLEQYQLVRLSSLALFKSYSETIASRMGVANGKPLSARALVALIVGHEAHHLGILKERYGLGIE